MRITVTDELSKRLWKAQQKLDLGILSPADIVAEVLKVYLDSEWGITIPKAKTANGLNEPKSTELEVPTKPKSKPYTGY